MSEAKILNSNDFNQQKLLVNGWVLVECSTVYSGFNNIMEPILKRVKKKYHKLSHYRINIDTHPLLTNCFHLPQKPTLILFNNGEFKDCFQGLVPFDDLDMLLDKYINKTE